MIKAKTDAEYNFAEQIDNDYEAIVTQAKRQAERSIEQASQACEILKAVNEIIPIELEGYWDLYGDIHVRIERESATDVIQQMRNAGYVFADASYTLHDAKDENRGDMVVVNRYVRDVEGNACEYAKDRLAIEWIAPYELGNKCKIVENVSTYTNRVLVCDK